MLLPRNAAQPHTDCFLFGFAHCCLQTSACCPALPLAFQTCSEAWQARQAPCTSSSPGEMPHGPLAAAQGKGKKESVAIKGSDHCVCLYIMTSQDAVHTLSIKML